MATPANPPHLADEIEVKKSDQAEGDDCGSRFPGWLKALGVVVGLLACLYVFLIGLGLMGDAFKCLGGRGAGEMFKAVNDPITGLMVGILATVLVQSSSTSTSIVVGLVAAEQISVNSAIPVIMGANIGTSVTNTIVSMGQMGNRVDLERSFAGATVHDMFNMLSVLVLLPLELLVHAIQGEGGVLYWISKSITDRLMGSDGGGELFKSPIEAITKPVTSALIRNDKYVMHALSLGAPAAAHVAANDTNATGCQPRRLEGLAPAGWSVPSDEERPVDVDSSRVLLNRRLDQVDCSRYYCVGDSLDHEFSKISKSGYRSLTPCEGYVAPSAIACGSRDMCYLDAGSFWDRYVENGRIINSGALNGAGDVGGGVIALILSLVLLVGGLFFLCKLLHVLLMGRAKRVIANATRLNDYLAMLVGVGVTIVVQSSSVVTSALTPLCGLGLLPLQKMLPLTLGANIGTTVTAMIAALATMEIHGLQIAMCHLWFNILGIVIWFPIPVMRELPLGAARLLGLYASYYRFVPALYILVAFGTIPSICLMVSFLFHASVAGGVLVVLMLAAAVGAFEYWWIRLGGCYRVLSEEERYQGLQELQDANCEAQGAAALDAECPPEQEAAPQVEVETAV